jgi:hypothetical protein
MFSAKRIHEQKNICRVDDEEGELVYNKQESFRR